MRYIAPEIHYEFRVAPVTVHTRGNEKFVTQWSCKQSEKVDKTPSQLLVDCLLMSFWRTGGCVVPDHSPDSPEIQ